MRWIVPTRRNEEAAEEVWTAYADARAFLGLTGYKMAKLLRVSQPVVEWRWRKRKNTPSSQYLARVIRELLREMARREGKPLDAYTEVAPPVAGDGIRVRAVPPIPRPTTFRAKPKRRIYPDEPEEEGAHAGAVSLGA